MSNKKNARWFSRLDYIFVLRPMLFFPGWSTMLAGFFIDSKYSWFDYYKNSQTIDYFNLIFLLIGFGMLMGSTFVLNQIKDIESDLKNKKLFIISNGYLSRKSALYEVILLFVISLILSFNINLTVGILFLIFFLVTGIGYNFKPLILKDKPWGSLFANAVMGWIAFAIGWCAVKSIGWQIFIDSIPYLLFNTSLYFFTILPDIEGDKSATKKTLAVQFGHKPIIISSFLIFIAGFIFALILNDRQALVFYLFSLPFFLRGVFTLKISHSIQTTKYSILFFALSICIRWPWYFIMMLSGYFLTKYYFKKRFNLDYPNFSGA